MTTRSLRRAPAWSLGLLTFLLLAADYRQEKGNAQWQLTVDRIEEDRLEVRLSTEMRLTLTVEGVAPLSFHPNEEDVVREQVKTLNAAGPWFLCEADGKPARQALPNGRERWQLAIRLDPLMPKDGKLTLRPAALDYAEGGTATRHRVEWQPVVVQVTTTVASTDLRKELRDVTPPEELPVAPSWMRFLPWIGLGLAGLGLVAGGWSLRHRFRRPPPPLTPSSWAERELLRIEDLKLPQSGEVDRFHTLLCNVIRSYLEQRFQLPASHQTTAEFLETMRRSSQLSTAQRDLLREFLERCDMAKFARAAPSQEECQKVGDMARSFVRETAPAAVSASPPAAVPNSRR